MTLSPFRGRAAGLLATVLAAALPFGAAAQEATQPQTQVDATAPLAAAPVPPMPQRPALVVDAESGAVLHAVNPHMLWHPASLTKMMTVYVALQAVRAGRVRLDQSLPVSALAARQPPSRMGFAAGSSVSLEAAIFVLMVKSANDVSVTVAEGVGGSLEAFIGEMNATSRRLGMGSSVWRNPNGLPDPLQVTTARDMAVLARALYRDFPEHHRFFRTAAVQFGPTTYRNYNPLIGRYPGADGMKTGFICASGFNLVASATRNGRRHVAVVLGERSARGRAEKAALLLERSWNMAGFTQAGWFGGGSTPTVDGLIRPASAPPVAPDLRQEICVERVGRNAPSESEEVEPAAQPPVMMLSDDQSPSRALAGMAAPTGVAAVAGAAGERPPLLGPTPANVTAVVLGGYVAQPVRARVRRGQRRPPAAPARPVQVAIAGAAMVGRGLPLPAATQPPATPAAATPARPAATSARPAARSPTPPARPAQRRRPAR